MMATESTQMTVNSGGWLHARGIDQATLASLKEKPGWISRSKLVILP